MLLERKIFFIKQQFEFMKFSGTYNIYDPETNIQVGVAKEESGTFVIYDYENNLAIVEIKNSFSFFRSKVTITNQNKEIIGYFQSKIFTLAGGFMIFNSNKNHVAEIKGTLTSKNFKFLDSTGLEIGTITKKWVGLKELFTTADNYMISLNNSKGNENETALVLAAGIVILSRRDIS